MIRFEGQSKTGGWSRNYKRGSELTRSVCTLRVVSSFSSSQSKLENMTTKFPPCCQLYIIVVMLLYDNSLIFYVIYNLCFYNFLACNYIFHKAILFVFVEMEVFA